MSSVPIRLNIIIKFLNFLYNKDVYKYYIFLQIKEVDGLLGRLINNLKRHDLYEKINIIILSDHGMARMNEKSTLNITQYVNESLFDANRTVYGATANIHPTEGNVIYLQF